MTSATATEPQRSPGLLDRSDERLDAQAGVGGAVRAFGRRVRAGDLGALPVVVGLVIICVVFEILNSVFLQADNLDNLLFDSCAVGTIALGIVCVLMLGEIDLSVGSVSGLSSALLGVLWINEGWPWIVAVVVAAVAGVVIGAVYAVLYNRFGMPSFVATLAGLLAFLGLQLNLLGKNGSINLPYGSTLVNFGQNDYMPAGAAYVIAALPSAALVLSGLRTAARRRAAGLSARSTALILTRAVALLIVLEAAVAYLNTSYGVPWLFGVFALLVAVMNYALTRTKWGRSMAAVGGNREAARRAGINVKRIYLTAFVLCSFFAALGGLFAAARLGSSSQQAGTGDVNLNAIAAAVIGGTSLFGGRGSAYSALLGVLVIQSISNGLTLLDLSSSLRYMITGAVLAIAVIVDSLARKSRTAHGAA
ncbi:sugar ABC transporter permease [uncultured Jatrophihabitans sp.]|uniref:sugar ABC transporter permease n=1 Tax=uncultured Jatrophihabitans sp. TaxID=1610747 RepID=UPI0035CC8326